MSTEPKRGRWEQWANHVLLQIERFEGLFLALTSALAELKASMLVEKGASDSCKGTVEHLSTSLEAVQKEMGEVKNDLLVIKTKLMIGGIVLGMVVGALVTAITGHLMGHLGK